MPRPESFNPIRLEVYRHLFFSIAEEMGTVLKRTAYSPNIKERRDYSCAVFDGQGQLAAMGDHMPVHLGSMPLSVRAALEAAPMFPGDVVIVNDPFSGGTHLPDITMVAPVYRPSPDFERPLFFVASRAHHSDIGGMTPGSMPLSQEIFQEGVIIPPLKLYEAGDLNRSLLRLLLHNVRTPSEREGDLAAQVGSLRVGEKRLLELIERNGADELETYLKALQDYSERMVRQLIAEIPDGEYSAEDCLDDEGMAERTSRPVKIKVTVKVQGDSMRVDFSGTDAQVQGSLNAVRAITVSAVFYIIRCLASEEVPSTAGLLRPIEVLAPQRSVVNACYPCATAGGNVETSQRIVDVVLRALAHALPERIPAASSGTMNNLALGGLKPVGQQPFSYYETIGGGMGAGPQGSGDNGIHTHMTNSLNTPIEALESEFPMRVREYRLRANSGGRGKHRGGDGLIRSLEMLTAARVTMLSERRKFSPYGLSGGGAGKKGMNFVTLRGRRKKLPGKFTMDLGRGDILTIETPGGGAWGGPEKARNAAAKRRQEKSPSPPASQREKLPPAAAAQKQPSAKDQQPSSKPKGGARDRAAKAESAPASRPAAKRRPESQEKRASQSSKGQPKPPAQQASLAGSPKQPASGSPRHPDPDQAQSASPDPKAADGARAVGKPPKPKAARPEALEPKSPDSPRPPQAPSSTQAVPEDRESQSLSFAKPRSAAPQPVDAEAQPDSPSTAQRPQKSSPPEPVLPLFPHAQVSPEEITPLDRPAGQRVAAVQSPAPPQSETIPDKSKPPQRPASTDPEPASAQRPSQSEDAFAGGKSSSQGSPLGPKSQSPPHLGVEKPSKQQGSPQRSTAQETAPTKAPQTAPPELSRTPLPQPKAAPESDKPAAKPPQGASGTGRRPPDKSDSMQRKATESGQEPDGETHPKNGPDR